METKTLFAASILRKNAWGQHASLVAETDGRIAWWSIKNNDNEVYRSLSCSKAEAIRNCEARS